MYFPGTTEDQRVKSTTNMQSSEKLNLRTGTGWRAFFQFMFGPPGPYDFPGKKSRILRTGDCFASVNLFGGPGTGTQISLPWSDSGSAQLKSGHAHAWNGSKSLSLGLDSSTGDAIVLVAPYRTIE